MVKIKQKIESPLQGSSYVLNLPQPPLRNAEEYLKAYIGYIYTAVGAITQEVASVELHLYKATFTKQGPKTQEIYEHPALSVLTYCNSISSLYDVIEATQTYLELTGEDFWVVLRDGKGEPREIWPVRPDWVKIIPSPTEVIDHYNYYAGGVLSDKVEIPKENVIPFKYFHPMNPYRGKGTVQAAALPFDILNFAQEYNRNFFFNSAIPSMVFSTEQKISEQVVKRFLNQWQSSFGGRSKSNKVAFLGQGLKLDKASFGAKELDFNEQMKTMRDDVLAVFKVPKTVLGLTDDVNRANADATTRAFMERVVTPRMRKFVATLNEFYLPMFVGNDNTLFFDFTDPSPEDVELKLKKYESARKYTWMTPNEIRVAENLEPLPGGDDLFAPLGGSVSPLGGLKPEGEEEETETPSEETPEGEEPSKPTGEEEMPKGIGAFVAKMLGRKPMQPKVYIPPTYLKNKSTKHMMPIPVKRIEKIEEEQLMAEFVGPLKKFIADLIAQDEYSALKKKRDKKDEIKDEVKEAMEEVNERDKKKKEAVVKNSGWSEEQKGAYWRQFIQQVTEREAEIKEKCQEVFNEQKGMVIDRLNDQMKSWRVRLGIKATAGQIVPSLAVLNRMWKALEDILRKIYIEQGNATMDFLGTGGSINITTEFASAYLVEYGGTLINGINDTTRTELMSSLSEGFDVGEGVDKLSKRVLDIFDKADKVRAEMIARTESIRASNSATVEAYRQSGVVVAKEWLAERDDRTCPFCEELDGKAISLNDNYFKQGDTYTVGEASMTLDFVDVGEPPLHVSCRCTTIPIIDTSQQGAITDEDMLKADVEDLLSKAERQATGFQKDVKKVAKKFKAEVVVAPVKSVERTLEKLKTEYADTDDPISYIMDTNRATILISNPKDFNSVVKAVEKEFGEAVRVKDKFMYPGYRSGIINVDTGKGVISEIAVTTPEMWEAREEGGGHKLYKLVRSGQDTTGEFYNKMMDLYEKANQDINERLSK